jgi:hypothetical protein
MRVLRCEIEILASAFSVEAVFGGDGLEQSRFPRAVFANEEGNGRMKFQPLEVPDRRDAEWVGLKIPNQLSLQADRLEERLFNYRHHGIWNVDSFWANLEPFP